MPIDYAEARAVGWKDDEINAFLASKGEAGVPPTQPATDTTAMPVQPNLSEKIGQGVLNVGKSLLSPFVRTGKNILGAGYEASRYGATQLAPLIGVPKNEQYKLYVNPNTGETVPNPFLNTQEVTKASEPINFQKGSTARQQAADLADIGSYAVPFGKGTNILTKAVVPGAVTGALQTLGQGGNRDVSPAEVVGGAALGAAVPTTLYGLGKFGQGLSKAGEKTTKVGEGITQGVRQIKVPGTVSGAQDEKAINEVMDALGFKGTPQQQYEKLQPAMTTLETNLRADLAKSPLQFEPELVKNEILTTLDDQGFLIGEKAKEAAQQTLDDVMSDLINKEGKTSLTSLDLFNVKQKLNKISERVGNKVDRGVTPSAQEEVLQASRDALDTMIGKYHPEVKAQTMAQSRLFDAARPLSAARFNPPVLRAMGTSVPAPVTTLGQQVAGGAVKGTGNVISALGKATPKVPINSVTGKIASRVIPTINDFNNNSDNTQNDLNTEGSQQQTNTEPKSVNQVTPSTTQSSVPQSETASSKVLNPYGATPDELGKLYLLALQSGDTKASNQLKIAYDTELAYQKSNNPVKKPVSSQTAKDQALAHSGMRGIEEVSTMLQKDPSILAKSFLVPGNLATRSYENAAMRAAEGILRLRTGAVVSPNEAKSYAQKFLPWYGDNAETVKYKLSQAQQDYQDLLGVYNSTDAPTSDNTNVIQALGGN